ncbi:MAG: hypothetical protein KIH63_002160 [Candidatus Saccharibacteria bacterium]|nr:hypothetical protein [Candidatus Saccharibacteria bacterium]
MKNPITGVKSRIANIERQPSRVDMGTNARIVHNTVGALCTAASLGLAAWGVKNGLPNVVSIDDGVSLSITSKAMKLFGGAGMSGGVAGWTLSRGINRIPSFDGTKSNSIASGSALMISTGVLLAGFVTAPETGQVTAAVPEQPPATVANTSPESPGSTIVTTSPPAETTGVVPADFGANCELVFADDGDGLVQGDRKSIYLFEYAANQYGYGPFDENGSLSEAEVQLAEVFKTAAAQSLGVDFRPGPDGQLTQQMCGFLEILNDDKPETPPIPAAILEG